MCRERIGCRLALEPGLNASMELRWRRQLRAGQLVGEAVLLPVKRVPVAPIPTTGKGVSGLIEIHFGEVVVRIKAHPMPVRLAPCCAVRGNARPTFRYPCLAGRWRG